MKCPTCSNPVVVGTVTDGDHRTSYAFCPKCRESESSETNLVTFCELDDGTGKADCATEERITDLLHRLPADSKVRLLAWSALQAWHSKALALIARGSAGKEVRAKLAELRAELLAELRELAGKDGAE